MSIKQNHKPGHIYRTRTKRWGTSDLLCIKAPSNELMFLNLTYMDSAAYSFHACQAEEIIKEWTKLGEYIHFKDKEKRK